MANPLLTMPQLRALRSLSVRTLERVGDEWHDGRQPFAHLTLVKLNQRGFARFSRDRKSIRITPAGRDALACSK